MRLSGIGGVCQGGSGPIRRRIQLTSVRVSKPEQLISPSAVYAPNPSLHYDFGDLFLNESGMVELMLLDSRLPVDDYSASGACLAALTLIEFDIDKANNSLEVTLNSQSISIDFNHISKVFVYVQCFLECPSIPATHFYPTNSSYCASQICSSFIAHCQTCLSSTHCLTCTNSSYYLSLNESACQECSNSLPNCLECVDFSQCLTCMSHFFETSGSCMKCSELIEYCSTCTSATECLSCYSGSLVAGGCSIVSGCVQVYQNFPGQSALNSQCLACTDDMVLQSGTCVCSKMGAILMSGVCMSSDDTGLIVIDLGNGRFYRSCNTSAGLVLGENNFCTCAVSGYEIINRQCQQICGDGKLFDMACDDGNLQDGDGCDSECRVEALHVCVNGTETTASQCTYVGRFDVGLVGMEGTDKANQGQIMFEISPVLGVLEKADWSNGASFDVDGVPIVITGSEFSNGGITLVFEYNFTIESSPDGYFNINFDSQHIRTYPQSVGFDFTVDSQGIKLAYTSNSDATQLIKEIVAAMSIMVLSLFVVLIGLHPTIGVLFLSAYQIVYLIHFQTKQYSLLFSCFQELSPTVGNALFLTNKQSSLPAVFTRQQQTFSIQNYQMNIILIMGALAVLGLVGGISWVLASLTGSPILKALSKWARRVTGSSLMSFCIPIFLLLLQGDESAESMPRSYLTYTLKGLAFIAMSLSWFSALGQSVNKGHTKSQLKLSRGLRLYLLLFSLIFGLSIVTEYNNLRVQTGLAVAIILWFMTRLALSCAFRERAVNKLGIFASVGMVGIFSIVVVLKNRLQVLSDEAIEEIIVYVLVSVMGLNLLIIALLTFHLFLQRIRQMLHSKTDNEGEDKAEGLQHLNAKATGQSMHEFSLSGHIKTIQSSLSRTLNRYTLQAQLESGEQEQPAELRLGQRSKVEKHQEEAYHRHQVRKQMKENLRMELKAPLQ